MNNIYIGIGKTREQKIPANVLFNSILENTNLELISFDISGLTNNDNHSGKTPFSLQRFLYAEALIGKNFEVAIYFDSDMCVFSDIKNLIQCFQSLNGEIATCNAPDNFKRRAQSSVIVFNKEGAKILNSRLNEYRNGNLTYEKLFYLTDISGWGLLDKDWNCFEYYDNNTKLIHWTDMDSQPWIRSDNYLGGLWIHALRRWCDSNPMNSKDLIFDIKCGYIRPSILDAINPPFSSHISFKYRVKDLFFIPPHRFKRIPKIIRKLFSPVLKIYIKNDE